MNPYRIFPKIYKISAQKSCRDCASFINKGSKILDLGCGSAIVGKAFKEHFQAEVIGVDIRDLRTNKLPFMEFDGRKLPFPDNCFDTVLINYVLHHAGDPEILLREAKRVSRDKIIVQEDLPDNFISNLYCKLHGFSFDKFLGNPSKTTFKSEKDWRKMWRELGLKVMFAKQINPLIIRKLFVLN